MERGKDMGKGQQRDKAPLFQAVEGCGEDAGPTREAAASERLAVSIIEQAGEAIVVCDNRGRIIRASRLAHQLCGKNPLLKPFDAMWPRMMLETGGLFSVTTPLKGETLESVEVEFRRDGGRAFHLLLNATPLRSTGGAIIGCVVTLADITGRKLAEQAVLRSNAILAGINRILQAALSGGTEENLSRTCLEIAEGITQSELGFIGELNGNGLEDVAISNPGWDVCTVIDAGGHRLPPGNFKIHGIYGRVILDGASLFTNEPDRHPDSIGLPPGHPPLQSFLGAPLIHEGRVIGMIAVGNRKGGYGTVEQGALEALVPAVVEAFMRKRAERALQESEERYQRLVRLAPIPLCFVNKSGELTYFNDRFVSMFGYTRNDVPTLEEWYRLVYPDERYRRLVVGIWESAVQRASETNTDIEPMEYRVTCKDGTVRLVEISGITIEGSYLATFADITERRQVETEREASLEFLRLVNESTSTQNLVESAVDFFQRQSGCEAVGVRLREGDDYPYYEFRGFPPEFVRTENSLCARDSDGQIVRDATGCPVIDCMCGNVICGRFDPALPFFTAYGSFWTNGTTELLARTTEADRQVRTRNRCNGEGYESVALIPLMFGDERLGLLQLNDRRPGLFTVGAIALWEKFSGYLTVALAKFRAEDGLLRAHDELEQRVRERTGNLVDSLRNLKLETTERLRVAEALREKEQMLIQQSRLAAMGEMIGNIAHQWRQPLNVLGLNVQQLMLLYDAGEFSRDVLAHGVTASMELIQHMSRTIDDFRNYFRPDKEKVEFRLSEAIAGTLSLMEGSFRHQHIAIDVVSQDDPAVTGYRNEFAQVILNILNNAGDIFRERGTKEPRVTITIGSQGGRAVVTIADNAGGIPPEIVGKVFDPYFTTKGPQSGTGLGLFMSKTIIEKNMGGMLTVRNTAEGAEFRIEV